MAKAIDMMIRVLDEARSVAFYEKALSLKIANRYEFDSFTLVYLSNAESPFEVELTINHGRKEPYELGTGYGHVAFTVDNLDAEHARVTAAGVKTNPTKEFHREGALMGRFFFIEDPDGYKIEVLQSHGRYR
jgi:lactoylglutathione lyase